MSLTRLDRPDLQCKGVSWDKKTPPFGGSFTQDFGQLEGCLRGCCCWGGGGVRGD